MYEIWHELHAWIEGMQFIPEDLKPAYKKYAFSKFKTYMNHNSFAYKFDEDLWKMWKDLDFFKYDQNPVKNKSKNFHNTPIRKVISPIKKMVKKMF